jgi:hypothetical protein
LKLSWQINVPKSSQVISHVNVELKTNVSENSYDSTREYFSTNISNCIFTTDKKQLPEYKLK